MEERARLAPAVPQATKNHDWLVVSTYPSEKYIKYEFVNWDDAIPNIWKNRIDVPVTTNQTMSVNHIHRSSIYEPCINHVNHKKVGMCAFFPRENQLSDRFLNGLCRLFVGSPAVMLCEAPFKQEGIELSNMRDRICTVL